MATDETKHTIKIIVAPEIIHSIKYTDTENIPVIEVNDNGRLIITQLDEDYSYNTVLAEFNQWMYYYTEY